VASETLRADSFELPVVEVCVQALNRIASPRNAKFRSRENKAPRRENKAPMSTVATICKGRPHLYQLRRRNSQ